MILATKENVLSLYFKNKADKQRNVLRQKSIRGLKELKDMGLLPLKISSDLSFSLFMHVLGLRYADGCIYEQKRNKSYTFYLCFGKKIDALRFINDAKDIWGINLKYHFSSRAYYVYLPASMARLMIYLGSPVGRKTTQLFKLPKWIYKLPNNLKWEFISGLFSGDGEVPRLKSYGTSSESLKIWINSEKSIADKFCKYFMFDIWKLLTELNIQATKPKVIWNYPRISKKGGVTYPIAIRILTQKQNMIKFLREISYTYCNKAYTQSKKVLDGLKGKKQIKELENYINSYNKDSMASGVWILLEEKIQKRLINDAIKKFSSNLRQNKDLAKYLKIKCPSFKNLSLSTIQESYLPKWKYHRWFMPVDCFIELAKLCNQKIEKLKEHIEKVKTRDISDKYAISLSPGGIWNDMFRPREYSTTKCWNTFGAGVISDKGEILSDVRSVYTTKEGGIIPIEAARHHERIYLDVVKEAIEKGKRKIDLVAYSRGPGLSFA